MENNKKNVIIRGAIVISRLFKEAIVFTLQELNSNKFRTFLSLLSVSIGIFTIVAILTAIDSLEKNIKKSFESLNPNMLSIQKWPMGPEDDEGNVVFSLNGDVEYKWWEYNKRPNITYADYKYLKEHLKNSEVLTFFISQWGDNATYKRNAITDVQTYCTTEDFDKIVSVKLKTGRQISELEFKNGSAVAIIGNNIASSLFEDEDPIGKTIKLKGYTLSVIGVLEKQGESMAGTEVELDGAIIIPYIYGKLIFSFRDTEEGVINAIAKNKESNTELIEEIKNTLRAFRRLRPGEKSNFSIGQMNIVEDILKELKGVISNIGWIIATFSLLIGGFSIANIMFVSVKERTRIIGIQKALGAKSYFILIQFLAESTILALAGALIGILLVVLIILLIPKDETFEIYFSLGNVIVGALIACVIGVLSGYLPARSAAKLNPVDAINSK